MIQDSAEGGTNEYYVAIGNSGANNSVLSISAFRYNEKVKPTTNQAFIARLPKLLCKASVQPVFTPESFSISTHITEKASNQASIRISATADVEKFVLYEDSSLTKEVSMFYRWNNKTAFNRGRTKLKAYNLYFTAPAIVGEYTYYVVAVDTNGNRSNPEAFVLTVTE